MARTVKKKRFVVQKEVELYDYDGKDDSGDELYIPCKAWLDVSTVDFDKTALAERWADQNKELFKGARYRVIATNGETYEVKEVTTTVTELVVEPASGKAE